MFVSRFRFSLPAASFVLLRCDFFVQRSCLPTDLVFLATDALAAVATSLSVDLRLSFVLVVRRLPLIFGCVVCLGGCRSFS
jgi:hypothetical protein